MKTQKTIRQLYASYADLAAFLWNGKEAELAPAYDVSILSRIGKEASQAMIIGQQRTLSSRTNALSRCEAFGITCQEGGHIFSEIIEGIHAHWKEACDVSELTTSGCQLLFGRAVLSETALL